MIYTITLNPSLDYIVEVKGFGAGRVNRTCDEQILAGGKGINVSIVLHNLGVGSVALGFTAGFTGAEIERLLTEKKVRTDFVRISGGMSRINVKVRGGSSLGASGNATESVAIAAAGEAKGNLATATEGNIASIDEETEINGSGPQIDEASMEKLFQKLEGLGAGDVLVLAGSIPASMPRTIYASIMERLAGKGVRIAVDATGEALRATLPWHPFLIKPNHHELGELFGVDLVGKSGGDLHALKELVREYAGKLREMGARNVLVSLGGRGAVLVAETGENYFVAAPRGRVINSVGAGDSMVAGFLAGYLGGEACEREEAGKGKACDALSVAGGEQNVAEQNGIARELKNATGQDGIARELKNATGQADVTGDLYVAALRWGVCAGSASAFSKELATRREVESLLSMT